MLYGVTFWVPNWKEDQIIRQLVAQGWTLAKAYGAAGITDLLPPPAARYCVRGMYAAVTAPGDHTCKGILGCLEQYLLFNRRMTIPQVAPEAVIGPPISGGIPPRWLKWIETVAPLVPDVPPPETPMVREGEYVPAPEWLAWMRTVALLLPDIPTPEPLPPGPLQVVPGRPEYEAVPTDGHGPAHVVPGRPEHHAVPTHGHVPAHEPLPPMEPPGAERADAGAPTWILAAGLALLVLLD